MIFFKEDLIYCIKIGLHELGVLLKPNGDLYFGFMAGDILNTGSYTTEVIMQKEIKKIIRFYNTYGFGMTGGKTYEMRVRGAWLFIKLEKIKGSLMYLVAKDRVSMDKKKYLKKGILLNPVEYKLIQLKRDAIRKQNKEKRKKKWDPFMKQPLKEQQTTR